MNQCCIDVLKCEYLMQEERIRRVPGMPTWLSRRVGDTQIPITRIDAHVDFVMVPMVFVPQCKDHSLMMTPPYPHAEVAAYRAEAHRQLVAEYGHMEKYEAPK